MARPSVLVIRAARALACTFALAPALVVLGCAPPTTVIVIPPCADHVDITGQARRLGPHRFELDHSLDLAFTKTELSFKGRGGEDALVLVNDRPGALRSVAGAGLAGLGALLLGSAWLEVSAGQSSLGDARPFYQAIGGGAFVALGVLVGVTGWHPEREYVEWQGACPAGDAAPSLDVEEHS